MKSLPNYSYFSPNQNIFSPTHKVAISAQTVPLEEKEEEEIKLPKVKKRDGIDILELNKKRNSNILHRMMIYKKESKIFTCVFKNIIFPNMFAFLFIFILMIIEDAIQFPCSENRNENKYMYSILRNAFLRVFFFNWWVALCLLDEKSPIIMKILMFLGVLTITFLIDYHGKYMLVIGNTDFDQYVFSVIFQVVFYVFAQMYQKELTKKQFTKLGFVIVYLFIVGLDEIFIRFYFIQMVYGRLKNIPNRKIVFQCFLFFFYQIKGKLFLGILNKFKKSIPANLFLFSIKYYIIDVLSSCVVLALVYDQVKNVQMFAIFNFSAQLISLYLQENVLLRYFCSLINFLRCKKNQKQKEKKISYSEIKSIIAGLTNEAIYVITFAVMNIIIFNRTMQLIKIENLFCVIYWNSDFVIFNPQNLCVLFAINFFYFFYRIFQMKDDGKIHFLWKLEDYSFFVRVYVIAIFQGYADNSFFFYMYLKKDILLIS